MVQVNYRDSRPIYQQIKDGIRQLIMSGALQPEDKLPSVREQAMTLAINPNTISRAYRELEAEGYIYTVSGRGTFVCERTGPDLARVKELMDKFDKIITELKLLGITEEEMVKHIKEIMNSGGSND